MARNVNIWTSNWQATGQQVQVNQYTLTVRVTWFDAEGIEHDREEEVLFPNCLAGEFTLRGLHALVAQGPPLRLPA